jgi:AraC-like DNA-binding protein
VAAFLDRHCHLPLSTQQVAWALGFEPSYFAKAFKRHAKESMAQYVKRVRLQRARKLFENPYLSISDVASQTGFSDASYFARVFRRAFDMTPSRYRALTGGAG